MQFLDHTYAPLRLCGKSENTLRIYHITIRNFSRYLEREPTLGDLTDDVLAAYLGWLRDQRHSLRRVRYSPHTIQKEYCQLTAMWRFACQRHLIDLYPTIAKPKAPRTDPQSWLPADLQKLFIAIGELQGTIGGVASAAWWRALHYMIWNTGERIGALLALQWSDIDLSGKWVVVRAEYRKSKTEDKTHAIADYTIEALRAIQRPVRDEVFPWPMSVKYLWKRYKVLLKRAGLTADRRSMFHRMRRTVATQFELAGGDATKLLGHFDRSVTEGHYLDPRVIKRVQAIDLLPQPGVVGASEARKPRAK
jgi:integrase